jgi:transposase
LIAHAQGRIFLGDAAYDALRLREAIAARGMQAVIKPNPTRKDPADYDKEIYKERHLVELFFNRLKHFRRIATRFEKTARNFLAIVQLASAKMWLFRDTT